MARSTTEVRTCAPVTRWIAAGGAFCTWRRRAATETRPLSFCARTPEDEGGNTPLVLACRAPNLELDTMLLDIGADASAANEEGDTPLLDAVAAGIA